MLAPGCGDAQFCSSAVIEPGCDTAEPEGEFDDEPLLCTGWLPVLVRFILLSPQGAVVGEGAGAGACDCATSGTNETSIVAAVAPITRRVKNEEVIRCCPFHV